MTGICFNLIYVHEHYLCEIWDFNDHKVSKLQDGKVTANQIILFIGKNLMDYDERGIPENPVVEMIEK